MTHSIIDGALGEKRSYFMTDLEWAYTQLNNYTIYLTVRKKAPTFGEIRFSHADIRHFDRLKDYAGDYGFVVPVRGGRSSKILKGEKPLKYTHI